MPPDVFLILASSGITLVASLLFLVGEKSPRFVDDPRLYVQYCLPPQRLLAIPPPLPRAPDCSVNFSTPGLQGVLNLRPVGAEWVVTLECQPLDDSAALQLRGKDGVGAVTDLRWHGKAGLARATRRQWKQKPGQA